MDTPHGSAFGHHTSWVVVRRPGNKNISLVWIDRVRPHILYSRCMLHYFVLCRPPKRLWEGEFLVWERGKVERRAGERGKGRCEMGHSQWQTATHTNVALDDRVDTGDFGDDEELGNVHECTHLDISTIPTLYLRLPACVDLGHLIMYS